MQFCKTTKHLLSIAMLSHYIGKVGYAFVRTVLHRISWQLFCTHFRLDTYQNYYCYQEKELKNVFERFRFLDFVHRPMFSQKT
jgi:hypothetical protein